MTGRPSPASSAAAHARRDVRLTPEQHVFVTERHLATLTTLRADGSPHVVPVGFTWDPEECVLRITSRGTSVKVRNIERAGDEGLRVAVCQVDGGRWLTFEGRATVSRDADEVAEAMRRYARRYRTLEPDPRRVVVRVAVRRVLGSAYMTR
ncbi:TIGR03618 family F420-dependent PPOX class oxidoreductase [Cellulomonas sp. APG4]|uniref:pyridoxamine 5'-phosphate oxidase family protein n=1 Tax=Cellulomonas sp. APG4 TaxID=1538656 RepID=UPI00137A0B1A|nr:TIGR03618 family F420-dependent PPOX class oxidoreductase [Cellulomonas sp. APG4]NCT89958.1 TIGR03618 family F420-dependent PPOX class oxidoreductase [Cellulomonas sp. APG4]